MRAVTVWLKIGLRNARRNARRSLFTMVAVGLGFAAVNVFAGFREYMNIGLRDGDIYALAQGHLTIVQRGFFERRENQRFALLISPGELRQVRKVLDGIPEVVISTPKLHLSGMVKTGRQTAVFFAVARIPSEVEALRARAPGMTSRLKLYEGEPLRDELPAGVGLSKGLAEKLGVDLGDPLQVVSHTAGGGLTELDAQLLNRFEAHAEWLDDKLMVMSLELAQGLAGSRDVDRVAVLLPSTKQIEPARRAIAAGLAERGLKMEVKSWEELDPIYRKAKHLVDVIFSFLFVIVLLIAASSVMNTVGVAVIERTREVGALRALGVEVADVIRMFVVESGALGLVGSVLGFLLTLVSIGLVQALEITWIPPHLTMQVPLEVFLVPRVALTSALVLVALSMASAVLPALRAARRVIPDALGHD